MSTLFPVVRSCCWCLGLETGAKAVGVLHTLVALVIVSVCSYMAAWFETRAAAAAAVEDRALYGRAHVAAAAVAAVSVAHVALGAALLYGAFKRHTACLRGWVWVMSSLWTVGAALAAGAGLVGGGADLTHTLLALAEGVLFFGAVAYCVVVVNSFYLLVKSSEDMEGPKHDDY